MSAEEVPHNITDRLINVFWNTSVEEFNSTFKDNIHIENRKYDPEDILNIAELTYTEVPRERKPLHLILLVLIRTKEEENDLLLWMANQTWRQSMENCSSITKKVNARTSAWRNHDCISSVAAKVASELISENNDAQLAACVASFSTIVKKWSSRCLLRILSLITNPQLSLSIQMCSPFIYFFGILCFNLVLWNLFIDL